MAPPTSRRPAALLLTGGASRRMGRDKAALMIEGKQLAGCTAALLQCVAEPVIEVGPGFTLLRNIQEVPPGSGPLAAVVAGAAALAQCQFAGPVLVVATDLPLLSRAYLGVLAGHPVPSPDHSVVPRDSRRRPQPLCARYSASAFAIAQGLVAEGHRSMKTLLEAVPVTWLDADPDTGAPGDVLRDIDTPQDLESVRRLLRQARHATPDEALDRAVRP